MTRERAEFSSMLISSPWGLVKRRFQKTGVRQVSLNHNAERKVNYLEKDLNHLTKLFNHLSS